ncbi:uncharacterized protein LOC110810558 [Carica papaya]|uniref:uncharacterized protein LOC110810558 n=1 Tax=Carica papaya TaxID=3649 RepID=UPI000B8C73A3|nr:uncharacterized protein LOC110810558 [Carica papaya]
MASSADLLSSNSNSRPQTPLLPLTVNPSSNISRKNFKTILHFIPTLATALVSIYSINLAMEISLFPKQPIFHITSLSLSNFTVSEKKLAAVWVVNVTVFNPSFALQVAIDEIESSILYKEDDPLSITSVNGFHLGLREKKDLRMKFATTGREPVVEYPVLREMGGEWRGGTVSFSLEMTMWSTYRTGLFGWSRRVYVNPYCLGLDVGFDDGRLIGSGPKDCMVLMLVT